MPQEKLDRPNVRTRRENVRGEGMTKRVNAGMLVHAGEMESNAKCTLNGAVRRVPTCELSGLSPRSLRCGWEDELPGKRGRC